LNGGGKMPVATNRLMEDKLAVTGIKGPNPLIFSRTHAVVKHIVGYPTIGRAGMGSLQAGDRDGAWE
jgi:hypothetical protein